MAETCFCRTVLNRFKPQKLANPANLQFCMQLLCRDACHAAAVACFEIYSFIIVVFLTVMC